ncbi:nucleoside 2-deoxyribosyltransferase domain-containing protein [Chitinophaga sp. GbtcB8]|uniref:nucleoside 2-deoxyribosyltransferase domain-containing protein n=1 Tax=Chitinophaga sp. GbtcB8 TaxID=2824753 RepID=UPI001C30DC29|nr:nucleoside 2-deoxyribosyltransferase domain-containing protein [Chitinophaga sp. GbtcB8]
MIIQSPHPLLPGTYSVFLAGSIEMGCAVNWQQQVGNAFRDDENIILYNPRRDDWDSSWKQEITSPAFNSLPGTQSPITLLELGLHARSEKLIVCCPEGFWRKGNVDIVCERFGIPQVTTIEDIISIITAKYYEHTQSHLPGKI